MKFKTVTGANLLRQRFGGKSWMVCSAFVQAARFVAKHQKKSLPSAFAVFVRTPIAA